MLLENVGVTDTNTQLLLNIIYALTGWIAATAGSRFHDKIGRRKMFLGSTGGMIICLAITAGTAAKFVHDGSMTASSASIAFIYIFGVVFAFAYTSMQPIYPGEVMSNDMRAKGMGTFKLTAGAAGFVNTFAAPVALRDVSLSVLSPESMLVTDSSCRLDTGSTSSSSSGTALSLLLSISSSWRLKDVPWRS